MAKVKVGSVLHGFCGGAFGRDSYDHKRVEAMGKGWLVARNERGVPEFYSGKKKRLEAYLKPNENDCDGGCNY